MPNRRVGSTPVTAPKRAVPKKPSSGQAPTDPSVRVSQPNMADPSKRVSGG
jgi:hypothetical protein